VECQDDLDEEKLQLEDSMTKRTGGTGGGSEHDADRLGRIEFTWRAGSSSAAHASDSISRVNSGGHTNEGLTQQRRAFGADLLTPPSQELLFVSEL
jgi:hypothetical protein